MFFFYAIILKVKQGNQQLLIQSERKLRRGGPAKIELARSGEGGARDLLGVEAERADKRAVLTFGKSSWDCLRSKVVSEPRLVLHLFCFCPLILHLLSLSIEEEAVQETVQGEGGYYFIFYYLHVEGITESPFYRGEKVRISRKIEKWQDVISCWRGDIVCYKRRMPLNEISELDFFHVKLINISELL